MSLFVIFVGVFFLRIITPPYKFYCWVEFLIVIISHFIGQLTWENNMKYGAKNTHFLSSFPECKKKIKIIDDVLPI